MTRWIRNLPIGHKLTLITLVTTGSALVAALVAFSLQQLRLERERVAGNLTVLAEVVATNITSPLAFSDKAAAEQIIRSLNAQKGIRYARLLNQAGDEVAGFGSIDREDGGPPSVGTRSDTQGTTISLEHPVMLRGTRIGSIQLGADITEAMAHFAVTTSVRAAIILVLALTLAWLLVAFLQRTITSPLSRLARTVRNVADRQDYSLRARRMSDDEIGGLTTDFNRMLEEVSRRDDDITTARRELALQVTVLEHEVAERHRAETQLKVAKEQAEAASQAKGSFLAAMSHEIRTPMNGVLGMTDILLESKLSNEQYEFARVIRSSGEALLNIINDVLDFSKIEADRIDLEVAPMDVRLLVEDIGELHAVAASKKGVEVVVDVEPGLSTSLLGDQHRLRQVVSNLIGNAVKFTASGEVRIQIATEADSFVRIGVRDSGIGIAPEVLGQLFKPFVQADTSTTRRFGGTGLGLAICKRLAELMGGTIDVQSTPGVGSEFTLRLPLKPDPAARNCAVVSESPPTSRILVLEPNASVRAVIAQACRTAGVDAVCLSSSSEALAHYCSTAAAGSTGATILSLSRKTPGDLRLLASIKASPALERCPIIALTPVDERINADELSSLGLAASITKPMRERLLWEAIREAVAPRSENRPMPREAEGTSESAPVPPEAERLRILLVEDNIVNQKVASIFLRKRNCDVAVANNGVEALAQLGKAAFDLILMDCQMSEMDGFEATRRIRAIESKHPTGRPRAFIVAMTANAMQGDRERCIDAGMDDYVSKPFKQSTIEELLAAASERRPAARARAA